MMALPAALPASPGNANADTESAALLGFQLFFDARLSSNHEVRCATCHVPERAFDDGRVTSTGIGVVERNSPSIYGAAWHRWQMWDGRADSLWSQALIPLEDPREMNFSRLELAHLMHDAFRPPYEAVFGALPSLDALPPRGKPGDASFDSLPVGTQLEINRIAANVGKALEAYQRRAAHGRGRFDAFVEGDRAALSEAEQRGFAAFLTAGCDRCHSGPLLSDDAFHDVGVLPAEGSLDRRGRARGLEAVASSPFSMAGVFNDGAREPAPLSSPADEGAWRTPSLRNVGRTAPYGHNGSHPTLESIVDLHTPVGSLTSRDREDLFAFLRALDADDPPSPWNNWPDR